MPENPTFSTVSGKWVILVLLGLGIVAAGFASYYRHSFTRRALAYWGGREANAITTAATVTLFELAADENREGEPFSWLGREFHPVRQIDLSKAGGLAHAREALVLDSAYRWDKKHPKPVPSDRLWLLRFEGGDGATTLVFVDLEQGFLGTHQKPEVLSMGETLRNGLSRFIEEKVN